MPVLLPSGAWGTLGKPAIPVVERGLALDLLASTVHLSSKPGRFSPRFQYDPVTQSMEPKDPQDHLSETSEEASCFPREGREDESTPEVEEDGCTSNDVHKDIVATPDVSRSTPLETPSDSDSEKDGGASISARRVPSKRQPPWWRRLLGLPGPPIYRVGEILRHVRDHYVFWPQSWFHGLLFVLLVFAFWMNAMNYWEGVIDDAYITFRFSDNFIHGRGLVYNLGQRVEGFTNFLWMAILGVVIGLRGDPMYWAKILGFGCSVAAIVGVVAFGAAFSRRRDPWNWLAVVPLAANAHFAHWSMMGLETQLQVALLTWTYVRFYVEMRDERCWNLSPLLAAMAAMTRIESLYYMTPLAAFALVQVARGRLDWRRFLRWGLWAALIFIPYFVWKYEYFGDVAPNTYYAKRVFHINHDRGIAHTLYWYFGQGEAYRNLWLIPLMMALLWWRPETLLVLGPLVLNAFYVYHVDGDWMPNLRFFQVALPFMGMLLLLGIRWVQHVLHDWRGKTAGLEEGEGRNGWPWLMAEVFIFAGFLWLLFHKGAALFEKGKVAGVPLWGLALGVTLLLLLLRWRSGMAVGAAKKKETACGGEAPSDENPEQPDARCSPGKTTASCSIGKASPSCVLWMGVEWLSLILFGWVLVYFAPRIGDLVTLVRQDLLITAFDLGWRETLPPPNAPALSLSKYTLFMITVGLLALGWIVRFISGGRLGRSLVRWPVYLGTGILLIFLVNTQLNIGSVYIFGVKPDVYPRNINWPRWSTVQMTLHKGFSPPLQNVADWMLENCQTESTIFMSDIGYPMWLSPHMSLIDVDGLVDKVIADAPSVREDRKPYEAYLEEDLEKVKQRRPLTPDQIKTIGNQAKQRYEKRVEAIQNEAEVKAKSELGENSADDRQYEERIESLVAEWMQKEKAIGEIREDMIREAKSKDPLSDGEIQDALRQAEHRYKEARYSYGAEYVLRQKPEYMNIFISHNKAEDPKSDGFVYPDVSQKVAKSPEFKESYVEVTAMNKYITSWNHIYRRKDVAVGIPPEEQARRWKEGIRRNPRMSYLYIKYAEALIASGEPYDGKPSELLRGAIHRFHGNEQFMNQLAHWGRQYGDDELVVMGWKASLKSHPEQDWLHRQLVDFYRSKDQFKEAVATAREAIESPAFKGDSHLLGLISRVANEALAKGHPAAAGDAWDLVVQAKPDRDWLYQKAAEFYQQQGNPQRAIAALKIGIDQCPGISLFSVLAELYENGDRMDDAEAVLLEAANKTEDRNPEPYIKLGELREKRNESELALKAYRKALEIQPRNPMAQGGVDRLQRPVAPQPPPPVPTPSGPPIPTRHP